MATVMLGLVVLTAERARPVVPSAMQGVGARTQLAALSTTGAALTKSDMVQPIRDSRGMREKECMVRRGDWSGQEGMGGREGEIGRYGIKNLVIRCKIGGGEPTSPTSISVIYHIFALRFFE
jgi:hypothetical protein